MPAVENGLALDRHHVRHQTPAGRERGPTAFEQVGLGDPPAHEDRVGGAQTFQGRDRATIHDLDPRDAECGAVRGDHLQAAAVGLDGDRAAPGMRAHPFDADGAAAGADVPEQLARRRPQRGQGDRPDLPLGELAVVLVELVGEARGARDRWDTRVRHALDGQGVQVRSRVTRSIRIRGRRMAPLVLPAQVGQHREPASAVAALAQQPRHLGGGARVRAQRQQPRTGLDEGLHQGQGPAVQAQGLHRLRRPAESCAGETERGRGGDDPHRFASEPLRQDGADAVAGRISGREHADRSVPKPVEGVGQRAERLGPGDGFACPRPRWIEMAHPIEMALSADHHPSLLDHRARRRRQPVRAVVAHAHHREPGLHPDRGPDSALTAAAAMALPPRRPRRVT